MIPTVDRISSFHCSAELHLWKEGGLTIAVYNLMYRVSKDSKKFTGSAQNIARHFACNERSVDDVFRKLEGSGFIIQIMSGKATYQSNTYQVLSHSEWAKVHPGMCPLKDSLPWSGDDPLGQKMYVESGCRITFLPFQLHNYRSFNFSDELVFGCWQDFLKENAEHLNSKRWCKEGGYKFWMWLKSPESTMGRKADSGTA